MKKLCFFFMHVCPRVEHENIRDASSRGFLPETQYPVILTETHPFNPY